MRLIRVNLAIMLWATLFLLFGSILCNGPDDEQDVTVTITDNNSMRKFGVPFDVYLTVQNTGKTMKRNVTLRYIHSQHVSLTGITLNGVGMNQIASPIHLLDELETEGEVLIKFSILLESKVTRSPITPGYHVDNILLDVKWTAGGITHNTGYKIVLLPFVMAGCDTTFDVKNGVLTKNQVSATSYYLSSSPQEFGENSVGWCAKAIDKKQYIEILFSKRVRLTSLRSSSRITKKDWISLYHLEYKKNGKWIFYKDNGAIKNFTGYKELEENKFPWFLPLLECEGLRIHPQEFQGGLICSKFQIKGCQIENTDTCIGAIGMENGEIPNASITERFANPSSNSTPAHARLNGQVYGWVGNTTYNDWLQIDLGSLFKITRIAIQDGFAQPHRVTKFKFCYSNNTRTWDCIQTGTGTVSTIYQGLEEGTSTEEISMVTLEQPVTARSFRIEPTEHVTMKVIRTELFGCPVKFLNVQERLGLQEEIHARTVLVSEPDGRIVMCRRKEKGSSCFSASESSDKRLYWRGVPQHVINVKGMDSDGNIYALTKVSTYVVNLNGSEVWSDISKDLFLRKQQESSFTRSVDILQIIPNIESLTLRWTLHNKKQISVSGRGIHVRDTTASPWQQIASWTCCGM